jgi:hypothetical protein
MAGGGHLGGHQHHHQAAIRKYQCKMCPQVQKAF